MGVVVNIRIWSGRGTTSIVFYNENERRERRGGSSEGVAW